jgi:hypothetical protein
VTSAQEVMMIGSLVVEVGIAVVAIGWWIRAARRRRADAVPVITTWPEIELTEPYGGWNANAYDARTGRDHTLPAAPGLPSGVGWAVPPRRTR